MGAFIGIVITCVFLFFLFKFPKQTFKFLGVLIFISISTGLCIWYFAYSVPEQKEKSLKANVVISLRYDTSVCSSKYPLNVTIKNKSNKTITKTSWRLNIYVPGYSTDISGYDNDYSCDKILKPGEEYSLCYTLPSSIKHDRHMVLSDLEYEVDTALWRKTISTK